MIPQPPGLQMPPGLHVPHPHQAQQSGPVQSQQQTQQSDQQPDQQPVQVRRRIRTNSKPKDSSEVAAILQDIKGNHLPITQDQISADRQEAQS